MRPSKRHASIVSCACLANIRWALEGKRPRQARAGSSVGGIRRPLPTIVERQTKAFRSGPAFVAVPPRMLPVWFTPKHSISPVVAHVLFRHCSGCTHTVLRSRISESGFLWAFTNSLIPGGPLSSAHGDKRRDPVVLVHAAWFAAGPFWNRAGLQRAVCPQQELTNCKDPGVSCCNQLV